MAVRELYLLRISSGDESTLGVMFDVDRVAKKPEFECYTLEDQANEPKVPGETRIPKGRYRIKERNAGGMIVRYKRRFPWHRGMLWLQDVPGFEWVYIHVGNKDDDTDGCILVGDGQVSNRVDLGQITSSVVAYRRLYSKVIAWLDAGDEVYIRVGEYA